MAYIGTSPLISNVTPGINQLTVDFTQDSVGSPAPTYYYSFDGTNLLGNGVSSSPLVISGISEFTTFYIIALNDAGPAVSQQDSGTPYVLGSTPTINAVTPGLNELTVDFTQDLVGNPQPTYYYSFDASGTTLLGSGVESSPLIISDISLSTTFYIIASNAAGIVSSTASSGVPYTLGSKPVITTVTPGLRQLTIAFTQSPSVGSPAPRYYYSTNGTTLLGTGVLSSPLTITNISSPTTFYIIASNAAGPVRSDISSGTPNVLGSKPVITNVTRGPYRLTVAFSQSPSVGSPAPTYYYSTNGTTLLGTGVLSSPLVISDISSSTNLYVFASNAAGNIRSDVSSGIPYIVGSKPSITSITPGTNTLTVAFTQTSTGNSTPTYYYSFNGTTLLGSGVSSSPLVISDISLSTTFYVIASNLGGNIRSDASSGVPNAVGLKPSITSITPGTRQLTVDFTQLSVGSPAPTYYYSFDASGSTLLGPGVLSSPLVISDISVTTTFYVIASNTAGIVASDVSSGIPNVVGVKPVITAVTPGIHQLTVAFTQSPLVGVPAPTYYYSFDASGSTLLGPGVLSSPLVISDISLATTFYVIASNSAGNVVSDASSGIPNVVGVKPVITAVTPGTHQLTVAFVQSPLVGSPPPTYYYSFDASGSTLLGPGVSSSPLVISDISLATTFYVIASNSAGKVVSDASSGIPNVVGLKPTITTVTPGTRQLSIAFTQSYVGSPAPTYYYSLDGSTPLGSGVSSSPLVISDISLATTFYVIALNPAGFVPSDASSGIPNVLGAKPVITAVTPGTRQLTVAFTQSPSVGVPAPTYYYSFDGTTPLGAGVSSSPLVISDISLATTFYVIALNSAGFVRSDASSGIPNVVGVKPTINTVTPGTRQLTVAFAQSYVGSPAPTYYYSLDGTTPLGTGVSSSPLVISDISLATTFYVIALNSAGYVPSDASSGIPNVVGLKPTITTVTPGTRQLSVAFTQSYVGSPAPTYYYSFDASGSTLLGPGVSSSPLVISDISLSTTFYVIASNPAGKVVSNVSSGIPNVVGSKPTIATVTPGTRQLTVAFTQSYVGVPAPTYYYSFDASGSTLLGPGVSSSPLVISDISLSTTFYLIASNPAGKVVSDVSSGIPNVVGVKPTITTIVPGTRQLTVNFTQSYVGVPAPRYYYSFDASGSTLLGPGVSSSPLVITDVSLSTTVYVIATNVAGNVVSDSASSVPDVVGVKPVITTVTPGTNQLTVAFTQSYVGSPAPTYYYSFNGTTRLGAGVSTSPLVISDISLSTAFYVIAYNPAGPVVSDLSSGIPKAVGLPPVITNVVAGRGNLTVYFTQSSLGSPAPTYRYSLNGTTALGTGVSSSPLVIPTINVPTNFYVVATNTVGSLFSAQATNAPLLFGLNDIIGNSLNISFQINNASTWVSNYSYGGSQIIYLQGPSRPSSPTGYEYITAYVKHSGELVVESYTNDVTGVGYKTFAVSFEDNTNTRLPPETLYICNLNVNEDKTVTVGFYYYVAVTGLWVFSGSMSTDSVSTSYSDWSIVQIGKGLTSYSNGNLMYSQLRINNVEIFPIAGPWFTIYKSYLLGILSSGTGSLTSPYYTFNYDRVSGNLPVRTYINGNMTSGILAVSNATRIDLNPGDGYTAGYAFNYLTIIEYFISAPNTNPPKIPCFGENARILCFNPDTFEEEYIVIQKIRKGTLVKTLRNGYVPVDMIGRTTIQNNYGDSDGRNKNRLYKCTKRNYPEMTNDELILTGCHCILVDEFKNEEEREKTIAVNRKIYITDDKYRLPACVDERAQIYEKSGSFPIYHLALENDDYYMNYGIYANGLLVETSSKRYMRELSNMVLL